MNPEVAKALVEEYTALINGAFQFDPERAKKQEEQFTSVNDVVSFYKQAIPERLRQLRGHGSKVSAIYGASADEPMVATS